jgi:TolB-like protein
VNRTLAIAALTETRRHVGAFELDLHTHELRHGSMIMRLQRQPFEILRLLLEHRGGVVTREQLRRRLWPEGTFVDFEHSLNAAIKRLRIALGEAANRPTVIETVPRLGYRLIGAEERPGEQRGAVTPRVTLAVLGFSNLSADRSQDFFSEGLTEELVAQLGSLRRRDVAIIARRSPMPFGGPWPDAGHIAEAVEADYVLEGSTRREGSRVRITARLVETASAVHQWSETYDRIVSDSLSVQVAVAGDLARSVLRELAPVVAG